MPYLTIMPSLHKKSEVPKAVIAFRASLFFVILFKWLGCVGFSLGRIFFNPIEKVGCSTWENKAIF
jgi:hypothetical protein